MGYEEKGWQRKKRKLRFARLLRKRMTKAEEMLWEELRRQRYAGLKFRRQVPILWYIVDFLYVEKNLIVELDGPIHLKQVPYDAERDAELCSRGYTILRFTNEQVLTDINAVLARIREAVG